jgi:Domain of unknown function (DUF4295)
MAKKTVASLQTSSKRLSKAIKMVKSPKTGAYTFVESIMAPEEVDTFLKKKYNNWLFFKHYFPISSISLLSALLENKGYKCRQDLMKTIDHL